jgi:hypothetical protein
MVTVLDLRKGKVLVKLRRPASLKYIDSINVLNKHLFWGYLANFPSLQRDVPPGSRLEY